MNTYGYFDRVVANLQQVNETQTENIRKFWRMKLQNDR